MSLKDAAPWHKESWDRFVNEFLPDLLKERVPLVDYRTEPTGPYTCEVEVIVQGADGDVLLSFNNLPKPDDAGVFKVDGSYRVVVPLASSPDLADAEIRCVGDQLRDFIAERLGDAPHSLDWDADLARSWLPIDEWFQEFHVGQWHTYLNGRYTYHQGSSQYLHVTNWLDVYTHLRRLSLEHIGREAVPPFRLTGIPVVVASQQGRVCPFCTPEGPNIGLILEIARGATIQNSRIVIVDDSPEGALGLGAASVPFLEHSDSNRVLMGVNMMRQWIGKPDPEMPIQEAGDFHAYQQMMVEADGLAPEPALVQTGHEPDTPFFWMGHNLLTAFISWDGDAFEDSIVVSESCADRMRTPDILAVGDKLSNRHGHKGVVGRILPDAEMPTLADGRPAELIYSVCSLPSRMAYGAVREAVMGRIAKTTGSPCIVPPFSAPKAEALREQLQNAGLDEDGMETLTVKGHPLERRSTAGWVYWGITNHLARDKIHAGTVPADYRAQAVGETEYRVLAQVGAFETIREQSHTCAAEQEGSDSLADRVASGSMAQATPPRAGYLRIVEGLRAGGIGATLGDSGLTFGFVEPDGDVLKLAKPVPHPWNASRFCDAVGATEDLAEYAALVASNGRLLRMLKDGMPESLTSKAAGHLATRVAEYLDALVHPAIMTFQSRVLFSGRTVIAPGPELGIDELGVAEEIAWSLFGPLAVRELGDPRPVQERSQRGAEALDKAMASSWLILYRAPAVAPMSYVGFRPRRIPENVLRIHPLVCELMNADFDGDQAAVFLPLTESGQQEAADLLSVAGHLRRDPGLIQALPPRMDAMMGLAKLSRSPEGLREIEELAGASIATTHGMVTRSTVIEAMAEVLEREGPEAALDVSQKLMHRGYEVSRELGMSMSPFVGSDLELPPKPKGNDADEWQAYSQEIEGFLVRSDIFDGDGWGPMNLMLKSGARGNARQLKQYLGGTGVVPDTEMNLVPIPHGWSEGLTPAEVFARVPGARRGLAGIVHEMEAFAKELQAEVKGYGVLARAHNVKRPGVVFARAAETAEVDFLEDAWSRLFVGLPV